MDSEELRNLNGMMKSQGTALWCIRDNNTCLHEAAICHQANIRVTRTPAVTPASAPSGCISISNPGGTWRPQPASARISAHPFCMAVWSVSACAPLPFFLFMWANTVPHVELVFFFCFFFICPIFYSSGAEGFLNANAVWKCFYVMRRLLTSLFSPLLGWLNRTLDMSTIILGLGKCSNHSPVCTKTAVTRPPCRVGLGTATSKLWCGPFVVWTQSNYDPTQVQPVWCFVRVNQPHCLHKMLPGCAFKGAIVHDYLWPKWWK